MLFRLQSKLNAWKFDSQIRGILETSPIRLASAPWTIVSMVAKRDAMMYLLSIKAFYRILGKGKLVAIVDRDTPSATRQLLERHLLGIEFAVLEDIDTGGCQRGGTWERLCYIIDRSQQEYTIQLDSDTLPIGSDLNEVLSCIERGQPFTMAGGWRQPELRSLREAADDARKIDSDHVVIAAQRLLDRYPDCDYLRYIRGSSGLAGFTPGGFSRSQLLELHDWMQKLLGNRWSEWGSEQFASNFAVANSPGAVVLPFPAYANFVPGIREHAEAIKFLHFIGSFRFDGGFFAAQGRKAIGLLQGSQGLA